MATGRMAALWAPALDPAPFRDFSSRAPNAAIRTQPLRSPTPCRPRRRRRGCPLARYICLKRCVNWREIGSFSWRFLSRMNWRSASSRSTPDTASRLTIVPRCTCQNFSGSSSASSSFNGVRISASPLRQHDARVFGVGLEVDDVGDGDQLDLLADRRLDPFHPRHVCGLIVARSSRHQRRQVDRRRGELAPDALDHGAQAVGLDRLQQVVDGAGVEGLAARTGRRR